METSRLVDALRGVLFLAVLILVGWWAFVRSESLDISDREVRVDPVRVSPFFEIEDDEPLSHEPPSTPGEPHHVK